LNWAQATSLRQWGHLRNEANEIAKLMEEELNKQRNKLRNNCPTK